MADESPWGFPSPDTAALKTQWDQFLTDPRGQAAMLSFAVQALQPRQFGQSAGGQFGESLAKGGEAIRGIDTQEQKQQELESKQGLREAQSNAAAARADTATMRTDYAGARLALQEKEAEARGVRGRNSGIIRAQNAYQAYVKPIEAANARETKDAATFARMPVLQPVLSLGQWLEKNPQLKALYEGGEQPAMGQGEGGTTPPTLTPPAPGTPDPLEGRTATGPNGKQIIRRNGKWEPL